MVIVLPVAGIVPCAETSACVRVPLITTSAASLSADATLVQTRVSMSEAGYPGVRQPHVKVLAHVPRGGGIRMSALAQRMELTKGAVTQLVSYLEGLGLVERLPDPDDGRAVIVRPTAAAHRGYEVARQ